MLVHLRSQSGLRHSFKLLLPLMLHAMGSITVLILAELVERYQRCSRAHGAPYV